MRSVYYQDAGNPIQRQRLPRGIRSTIELTAPLPPVQIMLRHAAKWLSVAMLLTLLILAICSPFGIAWLRPWDHLAGLTILAWCIGMAISYRSVQHLMNLPCFLAVFLLSLSASTPIWLLILLVACALGVLIFCFGKHWLILSTTSPMTPEAAEGVRVAGEQRLGVISVVFVLLLIFALFQLKIAILLLYVGPALCLIIIRSPDGLPLTRLQLFLNSLASWHSYEARELPGLVHSPAGPKPVRVMATILISCLLMILVIRAQPHVLMHYLDVAHGLFNQKLTDLHHEGVSFFTRFRYGILAAFLIYGVLALQPILLTLLVMFSVSAPVLQASVMAGLDRADEPAQKVDTWRKPRKQKPQPAKESVIRRDSEVDSWQRPQATALDILRSLRRGNEIERDSLYLGRVVADSSPVIVPRKIYKEHAHILGDSGSGKTSRALAPTMEQLISFGDCSVIVIDLKADSLELLATLDAAAERTREEKGIRLPLKYFSNQRNRATFAFNPMQQPFWKDLDLNTQTDLLLGAAGLTYGTDYGEGFYSSANLAIGEAAMRSGPQSIAEFVENLQQITDEEGSGELNKEIVKAASHVLETMKRLGSVEALNVTANTGHPQEVLNEAIDLTAVFNEPQLLYFHLSSTLSPSGAPEIARLVSSLLLAAATQSDRKHQVYLVIDEFQRMVSSNLEAMLQLARSMGVGMILANQSMADLKKGRTDLITPVEANCRMRQWFSVSSREDQERLIAVSGTTIETKRGYSRSLNDNDEQTETWSESEEALPRISLNDLLLMNDHPDHSILRIGRGEGYAQYGGMPVIIETNYHISPEVYKERRNMKWPGLLGSFLPGIVKGPIVSGPSPTPAPLPEPEWDEETIQKGDESPAPEGKEDVEDDLLKALKARLELSGEGKRRKK